jgi:hypothetical protein
MEVDNDINDNNLNVNHDYALLCLCSINNILKTIGFVSHELVAEELHMESSDEPASFAEAEGGSSWRKVTMEEMTPIEENGT